ncbi:hypothetical protein CRM22_003117 [Opisthorchis felineus]|uniref:Uncharacterized protein n=1 Tax=Opisthorchis felineus TaxID=147828 RepID=A0A4S2M935_OPIFE|nr:hypothetical protein CRM22_003117 [Opisthorchis felineus]
MTTTKPTKKKSTSSESETEDSSEEESEESDEESEVSEAQVAPGGRAQTTSKEKKSSLTESKSIEEVVDARMNSLLKELEQVKLWKTDMQATQEKLAENLTQCTKSVDEITRKLDQLSVKCRDAEERHEKLADLLKSVDERHSENWKGLKELVERNEATASAGSVHPIRDESDKNLRNLKPTDVTDAVQMTAGLDQGAIQFISERMLEAKQMRFHELLKHINL